MTGTEKPWKFHLEELLLYHIIGKSITVNAFVLDGNIAYDAFGPDIVTFTTSPLRFTDMLGIDANLLDYDITASNGVIHTMVSVSSLHFPSITFCC